jgi:hypothetical protein
MTAPAALRRLRARDRLGARGEPTRGLMPTPAAPQPRLHPAVERRAGVDAGLADVARRVPAARPGAHRLARQGGACRLREDGPRPALLPAGGGAGRSPRSPHAHGGLQRHGGVRAGEHPRRPGARAPAVRADHGRRLPTGQRRLALQPDRAGSAAARRRALPGARCPGQQRGAPHDREPRRAAARRAAVRDRPPAPVRRGRAVLPRVRREPAVPAHAPAGDPRRDAAAPTRGHRGGRPGAAGAHLRPRQRAGRRRREPHLERPEQAGGLLAAAVGTTTTLLVFAAWQALVAAVSLSTRSLRRAHA